MGRDRYESPLCGRYASREMQELFSDDWKFGGEGWRRAWYELARVEHVLGAPVSEEQVADLLQHLNDPVDYAMAAALEKEKRHDVVAHALTLGHACPKAAPIIHLAATSCDVTDNVDLVQMRIGLGFLANGLARVINRLARFAEQYKSLPTLGYTHYQPASLTTVGKRACLWLQNFLMDLQHLEWVRAGIRLRGLKGATGTQDSFLTLFDGDHSKVVALDQSFTEAFGLARSFIITGQTYPRKVDTWVLNVLSGIAQSASKMGNDIRLLAHDEEVEEPREAGQVGSSAMPWKFNPMRNERSCSLSRLPLVFALAGAITESVQWLERSLDDSAARRVYIPESFLATDSILRVVQNVSEGLVVYPAVIARRIQEKLPFMAIEKFMVAMVKAGANRQECHERLRVLSHQASAAVRAEGGTNDLLDRIRADQYFTPIHDKLDQLLDPSTFIGRAPEQVIEFLKQEVEPVLAFYRTALDGSVELSV